MTLTNDDLAAIGNLIDQKVDQKLEKATQIILTQMKRETKQIVKFFDNEYLNHDKRIKRLENKAGLPPYND